MTPGTTQIGPARRGIGSGPIVQPVAGGSGCSAFARFGAAVALAAARAPTAGGRAPGLHLLDRLRH